MRPFFLFTDWAFIIYWVVTALAALKIVTIPPEYLFNGYEIPRVVAWNWSFFPLDIIFSLVGLRAVSLYKKGNPRWYEYALISLVLTFCAGLMAISYWALVGDFQLSWWIANLFLIVWPSWFLVKIIQA